MLEDKSDSHAPVVDKYHAITAAYTMTVRDYVLRVIGNQTTNAYTVTLPPVAEAKGRFYSIVARVADAVNTVTINDNNNDSECWADIILNGKCDCALLYSDGLKWHQLAVTTFSDTAAPSTAAPTTVAPTTGTGQV